jgi:adenylylsulfate kinase-like enzyme
MVVICSFISPLATQRLFARRLIPPGRYIEIYVRCDLEVCKRRDPRGLYGKAVAGEIQYFTGISSPYEAPTNPEMVVDTDLDNLDRIVNQILDRLEQGDIIPYISR